MTIANILVNLSGQEFYKLVYTCYRMSISNRNNIFKMRFKVILMENESYIVTTRVAS